MTSFKVGLISIYFGIGLFFLTMAIGVFLRMGTLVPMAVMVVAPIAVGVVKSLRGRKDEERLWSILLVIAFLVPVACLILWLALLAHSDV